VSDRDTPGGRPPAPTEIVQVPPGDDKRSYAELDTRTMVFELQGAIYELKGLIAALTSTVHQGFDRIDAVERGGAETREVLRSLVPKIEHLAGFTTHRAPHLVDKADLITLQATLTAEIEKRPTRRQAIVDIALIVGLIGALLTIGSHMAR
jgi:hypothetical protein